MKLNITKKQARYILFAIEIACEEHFPPDKEEAQVIVPLSNMEWDKEFKEQIIREMG